MSSEAAPRQANRLARETSPYLLQHSQNPVDWYAWGPEALARAKAEDKPILLSIGYAACHWCHVMERESFENEEIARLMNEHFVPIKVDREERPDIDEIYMAATVAMSGSGGWPMTVFLTPEQEPFFAGTYFPPVDRYGRPGFKTLLEKISSLWKTERQNVMQQASELTEHVRQQSLSAPATAVSADAVSGFVRQLGASFDPRWGGFGSAPKFPAPASLSLLLRHYRHTKEERSLEMARRTLDGMKNGGMYDQLGGGFARYSTDERWLVPHFEKMLYDNAQLARVYLEAYQVTGDEEYQRIARETLDYVVREMQAPAGGYFSATDADSEGEEGKFFVFTPDETAEVLGADEAERFNLFYDVSAGGNWEGKSILNTPRPPAVVARELGISEAELKESLERSRQKLYDARSKRVPPLLDDKVLVAWNALMIGAMSEGHRVLGDAKYLASAERAARFVLEHMRRPDGGLFRTARDGRAHLDAYLEDYAYFSDALIDLYEAGGAPSWLHQALVLAERMIEDFGDPEGGGYYFTAKTHEALIVRTREGNDGAVPNPNATAARALARLSFHFAREPLRLRAQQAIEAYGRLIERAPRAFANSIAVVDFLLEPPLELALVGTPGDAAYEALWREVAAHYLPNRIVAHIDPAAPPAPELSAPLVEGKGLVRGAPALYVCRNFTCQAPVTDPREVRAALERAREEASGARAQLLSASRISGAATADATTAYASRYGTRHGPSAYTKLGQTGLSASRIGFGGYRIAESHPDHRGALIKALREGCNLIDTSTNYTDGSSERLIGQVLAELVKKRELSRSEIVIVSKIGYVQGQNLELAVEREAQKKPFPEMVKYADEVWHCIHPDWLEDQLTRSLARLGLETLDVCLLHNPEYYFSDAVKRGQGPLTKLRDEFYRRLALAFGHFEQEVARGRISSYGVSSNSAVASADDREATELHRMLEAAREAGGQGHHFRVLELPMNLSESGALFQKNNGPDRGDTVLEHAARQGIAILVNRPLNAVAGPGLVRLADPPDDLVGGRRPSAGPADVVDAPVFDQQLGRVALLEDEFRRSLAPVLRSRAGGPSPNDFFRWAEQLKEMPARLESFEQWSEIEERAIAPHVAHLIDVLDHTFEGQLAASFRDWRGRYLSELEGLLSSLRKRAVERSAARARALHAALNQSLPEERRGESLSRKALFALCSIPSVSSVLVGMREARYVDDALGMMAWPPQAHPEKLFDALRQARIPGLTS